MIAKIRKFRNAQYRNCQFLRTPKLTMFDALKQLADRGDSRAIRLGSRHGLV
jgi:hypothetical protein